MIIASFTVFALEALLVLDPPLLVLLLLLPELPQADTPTASASAAVAVANATLFFFPERPNDMRNPPRLDDL
ncbi:MAG TPA: hypothetical protein VGF74_21170 [Thermoleophilaceae bacterium]